MSAGKLVRDGVPAIIRATGGQPRTYTADPAEYARRLLDKLAEETREYAGSGDPAELADILEVLYALAALDGITPWAIEAARAAKAAERGGFTARIVWTGNQPAPAPGACRMTGGYRPDLGWHRAPDCDRCKDTGRFRENGTEAHCGCKRGTATATLTSPTPNRTTTGTTRKGRPPPRSSPHRLDRPIGP